MDNLKQFAQEVGADIKRLSNQQLPSNIPTDIAAIKKVVNQSPTIYLSRGGNKVHSYLPQGCIVEGKRYIVRLVGFFEYPQGVKPPADPTKTVTYTLTKDYSTGIDLWGSEAFRRSFVYNPASKIGIIHLDLKGGSSKSIYNMVFSLPADAPRPVELTETTF